MTQRSLEGKRVLVGGGTGDVGEGIVASLLDKGAMVSVLVRSDAKTGQLPRRASLKTIFGFPEDDAGVEHLRNELATHGGYDAAIANLGGWFHGPDLVDLPLADWNATIASKLTSHYRFARVAVPSVTPGGSYILIIGGAAAVPAPHSGVVSIAGHAQIMLAKVLAAEHPDIAVQPVMIHTPVATRSRRHVDPVWPTAREVGDVCAWLMGDEGRLTAGDVVSLHQHRKLPAAAGARVDGGP